MKKLKLSKKEYHEPVTKGYLEEKDYITKSYLDEKNYVTAGYLDKKDYVTKGYLSEFLEKKDYVTKKYFDETLDRKIDDKISRYTGVIIENFRAELKVVIEYLQINMDHRDSQHEEAKSEIQKHENWLHRHEHRLGELEQGFSSN